MTTVYKTERQALAPAPAPMVSLLYSSLVFRLLKEN